MAMGTVPPPVVGFSPSGPATSSLPAPLPQLGSCKPEFAVTPAVMPAITIIVATIGNSACLTGRIIGYLPQSSVPEPVWAVMQIGPPPDACSCVYHRGGRHSYLTHGDRAMHSQDTANAVIASLESPARNPSAPVSCRH